MGENHACAVCVKPSSPANMEDNLAVTNGEVINIARLGETVGLKVMPTLPPQITLIKIYVNDTNLQACLGQCAGMFFFDVAYFKQVENALGENHTCQGLIDGCGCIVCHAAKVANFLESLPLRSDILVRHRLGSSTDFCAWALIAQTFATLLIAIGSIDKLYFPCTVWFLILRDNPDISGNAGIIKEVVGQLYDGI